MKNFTEQDPIIAIDGPAGSGKSSVAKRVAKLLELPHIDTGAMYRAITLKALQLHLNLSNGQQLGTLADSTSIQFGVSGEVILDAADVTTQIRSPIVSSSVSQVSAHLEVRQRMVTLQREIGKLGGVLEGRDIGTVVFPNAKLKVFLLASLEVRAKRRQNDLLELGIQKTLDEVEAELEERDRLDCGRTHSPLRKAREAKALDTSQLTIDEVVERIVDWARQAGFCNSWVAL